MRKNKRKFKINNNNNIMNNKIRNKIIKINKNNFIQANKKIQIFKFKNPERKSMMTLKWTLMK